MRVIFFGNGYDYSIAYLQALVDAGVEVAAIVAPIKGGEPGKAVLGRSKRFAAALAARLPESFRRAMPGAMGEKFAVRLSELAQQSGATLYWPSTVNDPCLVDELALLGSELVVMAGFNEILKGFVLKDLGPVLNVHPSLLPHFRGPNPEFWVIAEGAHESGVTIHLVDAGIDTGPVLAQQRFVVEPWLTGGDLHQRGMQIGRKLLQKVLADWQGEQTPRWPQEGEGSYFSRVADKDLAVPFHEPAGRVFALSRAVTPWSALHGWVPRDWWDAAPRPYNTAPMSRTGGAGLVRLNLRYPVSFPDFNAQPMGSAVRTEGGGLAVACAQGTIFFGHVQAL